LPNAVLQAGFGGVVASLWSVADISSAMLMEHFYRCWREDKLPPAHPLGAAQRWLRATTNREGPLSVQSGICCGAGALGRGDWRSFWADLLL
jgi:CHAT domain-containing protein